ncbi:MAG: bifunctional diaminohydroxyphosphoribosylaminopyrimidine deaminase/5-amino-6-(5-phosphoribosylamino)uracil reductase RibD [Pseudomonadota bacterium]
MGGASAATAEDHRWMRAALALVTRGAGQTSPNPCVGALIVRDGRLLSRAVTALGGRPHAEAAALAKLAPGGAEGATVYVTLEPCAHHGRTPPCADALVAAGVARVVCPGIDPDPRVSGRGFATLRAAGVAVVTGVLAAEAARVNEAFVTRLTQGRPHVVLKLATTLDGRIATARGESRWITGAPARRRVHVMRRRADAVMVGIGTALADDPMLDARAVGTGLRQPARVIVDGSLALPPHSRLAQTAPAMPLIVLHGPAADDLRRRALQAAGATLLPIAETAPARPSAGQSGTTQPRPDPHPSVHGQPRRPLDLEAGLRALAAEGIAEVLCEGGGTLAAALLRAGLVDELALFTAGRAFGAGGAPALGPLTPAPLAGMPAFALQSLEVLGEDVLTLWRPAAPAAAGGTMA